jgi:hypothetical protein
MQCRVRRDEKAHPGAADPELSQASVKQLAGGVAVSRAGLKLSALATQLDYGGPLGIGSPTVSLNSVMLRPKVWGLSS